MMRLQIPLFALGLFSLFVGSCSTPLPGLTEQPATADFKPYPLDNCLVTTEGLDSKTGVITRYYQGKEIKVCCKACLAAFKSSPEVFMSKVK